MATSRQRADDRLFARQSAVKRKTRRVYEGPKRPLKAGSVVADFNKGTFTKIGKGGRVKSVTGPSATGKSPNRLPVGRKQKRDRIGRFA